MFRFPRNDEHSVIVGRTGSGKSQLGFFLLSQRNLSATPNIIIDYKRERLFDRLDRVRNIDFDVVPDEPGLYRLIARPKVDDDAIDEWFFKVLDHENIGLLFDEGYMVPDFGGFQALLTQGRAKSIPIITLSQRPVDINRFVFSEASHVALFHLNDERDEKTVRGFTPKGFVEWLPDKYSGTRLPAYFSRWYNINDDEKYIVEPVPNAETIAEAIDDQLTPKRRWL